MSFYDIKCCCFVLVSCLSYHVKKKCMTETYETLYRKKTIDQHQYICNTCEYACRANCLVSMLKASKIHSWLCDRCSLAELPFYLVSSHSLVDKSLDVVDAVVDIELEEDQLSFSPMEWFNCNIKGYYKNNLKIAHVKC